MIHRLKSGIPDSQWHLVEFSSKQNPFKRWGRDRLGVGPFIYLYTCFLSKIYFFCSFSHFWNLGRSTPTRSHILHVFRFPLCRLPPCCLPPCCLPPCCLTLCCLTLSRLTLSIFPHVLVLTLCRLPLFVV